MVFFIFDSSHQLAIKIPLYVFFIPLDTIGVKIIGKADTRIISLGIRFIRSTSQN